MNTNIFESSTGICNDTCWKNAKELHNQQIADYQLYETNFVPCENPYVRMNDMYLNHPNLRGRPGYGLSDDCLIDNYSALRNDPTSLTHDRCRIQLFNRIFAGGPNLRCGNTNKEEELDILAGNDTNPFRCRKIIMEEQIKHPIPLIDCMKDVQNPKHIVPIWVNGGEDTRSYVNRVEFNKKCNLYGGNQKAML
jgi:hypothetical protein